MTQPANPQGIRSRSEESEMASEPHDESRHREAVGLETGHLRSAQIIALALTSQTPAVALATVPFLLILTAGNGSWLGALIIAFTTACIGISVITFSRRYVGTGSVYSYMPHVFGAWGRLLVGATLAVGFIVLISGVLLLTGIFAGSFLVAIGLNSSLSAGAITVTSTAAIATAAALAYRGLDASVRTAVVLTLMTVPIIVLITLAIAMHTGLDIGTQLNLEGASISGIFQGVAAGSVFVVAFESSAALAAETKSPKRNIPFAVMSIPVILGAAYLVATVLQVPGLIAATDAINAGLSPAAAMAQEAELGDVFVKSIDLVLAVANLASLIAFVNYGSRFFATLATDGLLPGAVAKVHRRFRSPNVAAVVLAAAAEACLLLLVWLYPNDLLTKVFPSLSTLTVYAWVIPWVLICLGSIVLRIRERRVRPLPVLTALVGASATVWIYVNAIVNPPPAPVDEMTYVFLVAAGVTFTVFVGLDRKRLRRERSAVAPSSGPNTPPVE
jgi:amino acid transporter